MKLFYYEPITDDQIREIELLDIVTSEAPDTFEMDGKWIELPPLAGDEPRMFDEEPQDVVTAVKPH